MLDKQKILDAFEKLKAEAGIKQEDIADAMGVKPSQISNLKKTQKFFNLDELDKMAGILGMPVERLVLPGLTEADKYINFNQSGAKDSNVSKFAKEPHQHSSPTLTKGLDYELQQKLYESQESRISLLEQMITIKDNEINALKIELNNCKNALKKQQ